MAEPRVPYAEVIGDPIDHSLSPDIHQHWLTQLGLEGSYRRVRCSPAELEAYFDRRAADPMWRGCSVAMPLKETAGRLLPGCSLGAINCVARRESGLVGLNTDVDGVGEALGSAALRGEPAVVIGAGGAARAAVAALTERGARITILARSPDKAERLREIGEIAILPLEQAGAALRGAAAIVNATPLGMALVEPLPAAILEALPTAPGAIAVDMVYRPLDTPFLKSAAAAGLRTADGLTVLIAQARRQFQTFFGAAPPADQVELYALLSLRLRAD